MSNREILFRGRGKEDGSGCGGKWWEGFYRCHEDHATITGWDDKHGWGSVTVDKETVGQYTGLKDKNGTKIFEGDVVFSCNDKGLISWSKYMSSWYVQFNDGTEDCLNNFHHQMFEVIGNIHDNPELLENTGE